MRPPDEPGSPETLLCLILPHLFLSGSTKRPSGDSQLNRFSGDYDRPPFARPDRTWRAEEGEETNMETLWGSKVTRAQLQQSISNLRQLDELPEIPRENLVNPEIDSTRQLSVVREKEIVCNLAFLSATSDDSLNVMAVCVEEHCNGRGITIRVASNTGDLSAVTVGFIRLARALEHAASRGWAIHLLPTLY